MNAQGSDNSTRPIYGDVLEGLYNRRLPPWLPAGLEERFWIDANRRMLDVARIVQRDFPLASAYARAVFGDDLIAQAAASVARFRGQAGTLEEAIHRGVGEWVDANGNLALATLHRYDRLRRLDPVAVDDDAVGPLLADSGAPLPVPYAWAAFQVDALALARLAKLYAGAGAPGFLYEALVPVSRPQVVATYRCRTAIFARDLTAVLRDIARAGGASGAAAAALVSAA